MAFNPLPLGTSYEATAAALFWNILPPVSINAFTSLNCISSFAADGAQFAPFNTCVVLTFPGLSFGPKYESALLDQKIDTPRITVISCFAIIIFYYELKIKFNTQTNSSW